MKFVSYEHHGDTVWVREDLKGKHKQYSLCYSCALFKSEDDENCEIAQDIYDMGIAYNIVTAVWECPDFEPLRD